MAFIEIEELEKSYGGNNVLKQVSLSIETGSFVTLLGPSGCGKSTLLRCLAGLETTNAGRITLDGEDITNIPAKDRGIGMVFQQYSLFPNMNVWENIAFGLKINKVPAEEIENRVRDALKMVELESKIKAMPYELSGGQQQRVALARSIVTLPKILLLDEPLSAIDAKLRKSLRKHIKKINTELGLTCIFVTHDQDEALIMSDVIYLLNNGVVEQDGAPIDIYTSPKSKYAAEFIGNYNILSREKFRDILHVEPPAENIAIRPEVIEITQGEPQVDKELFYTASAIVKSFVPHGNVLRYTLEFNNHELHADVLFRSFNLYSENEEVFISLEKRNCLKLES